MAGRYYPPPTRHSTHDTPPPATRLYVLPLLSAPAPPCPGAGSSRGSLVHSGSTLGLARRDRVTSARSACSATRDSTTCIKRRSGSTSGRSARLTAHSMKPVPPALLSLKPCSCRRSTRPERGGTVRARTAAAYRKAVAMRACTRHLQLHKAMRRSVATSP